MSYVSKCFINLFLQSFGVIINYFLIFILDLIALIGAQGVTSNFYSTALSNIQVPSTNCAPNPSIDSATAIILFQQQQQSAQQNLQVNSETGGKQVTPAFFWPLEIKQQYASTVAQQQQNFLRQQQYDIYQKTVSQTSTNSNRYESKK